MAVDDFIMTFNSDDELPSEADEAPEFVGSASARPSKKAEQQRLPRIEGKGKEAKKNGKKDRKRKRSVLEEKKDEEEEGLGAMDAGFTFDGLGGGQPGKAATDVYVSIH
jgi:hypothetical protein